MSSIPSQISLQLQPFVIAHCALIVLGVIGASAWTLTVHEQWACCYVALNLLADARSRNAVARAQLVKEVTQYRTLSQLRDQLAVVSAPSPAVES